jgi:hypothetical protein
MDVHRTALGKVLLSGVDEETLRGIVGTWLAAPQRKHDFLAAPLTRRDAEHP